MVRLYLLGLIWCILLTGCGGATPETSPSTSIAGVAPTTAPLDSGPTTPANLPTDIPASTVPNLQTSLPTLSPASDSASLTGWTTVDWEGLIIPIPPLHSWDPGVDVPVLDTTTPIVTQSQIRFDQTNNQQPPIEAPSGFRFAMLQFTGSPEEWLVQEQTTNPMSIDPQSVQETTIAGKPALLYRPMVTGTGLTQMYVLTLEPEKLLWISTDIIYPGYEDVIAGIRLKE